MKSLSSAADALRHATLAMENPPLEIHRRQLTEYADALIRQKTFVKDRINNDVPDRLLLMEHPAVVTLGRSGTIDDLMCSEEHLADNKVRLHRVSRGGMATYHGPGQLVAYPIIKLADRDLREYLGKLLNVAVSVLETYGLEPELKSDTPGVWVNGAKIASVGIAVEKWVTYHGVGLNVNTDLKGFGLIIPCGHAGEQITSMKEVLGHSLDLDAVEDAFIQAFCREFGYRTVFPKPHNHLEKPIWFKKKPVSYASLNNMEQHLRASGLASVCEQAHCPNLGECFSRGTATFMILGDICTRGCRFCAVQKGRPQPLDPLEPNRLAKSVSELNLSYVVVTSVTRDDLPDGGAGAFAKTIQSIRILSPGTGIEILTPDFKGSETALQMIVDAGPDMFNHNIETVPRLYSRVRPDADYRLSLYVLERMAGAGLPVKSGLMLGLGESAEEIENTLNDMFDTGCRYLTLGQYLAPSKKHVPIVHYLSPEEFDVWADIAREIGFAGVASAPLVRSSYRAELMGEKLLEQNLKQDCC